MMSFHKDVDKLLDKYTTIWNNIDDLKNIELNALPVYDNRYIKIRTHGDKVYTNFRGLNEPEYDIRCGSFIIISINSLLVYENKNYLHVYLDICAYKIVDKQIINYLGDSLIKISFQ